MWYPIYTPEGEEVYPIRNDGSEGRWRWGKKKLLKAEKQIEEGKTVKASEVFKELEAQYGF